MQQNQLLSIYFTIIFPHWLEKVKSFTKSQPGLNKNFKTMLISWLCIRKAIVCVYNKLPTQKATISPWVLHSHEIHYINYFISLSKGWHNWLLSVNIHHGFIHTIFVNYLFLSSCQTGIIVLKWQWTGCSWNCEYLVRRRTILWDDAGFKKWIGTAAYYWR